MRLPGWCETCKKFKQVKVSGNGLVAIRTGLAFGICDACADAAEKKRKGRP